MSKWNIVDSYKPAAEQFIEAASLRVLSSPTEYKIENEETGDTRYTLARNTKELSDNIKHGRLREKPSFH